MELARRIGAVERFHLSERFLELASTAIRLRHRHAGRLATTRPDDLTDGHLAETVLRLEAWIAEQPPLPVHPDSYRARHGV
jgi:hypothetical protein